MSKTRTKPKIFEKFSKKNFLKIFQFFLLLCAIWKISSIFRLFENFENLHQNSPLPYTCQTRFLAWSISNVPSLDGHALRCVQSLAHLVSLFDRVPYAPSLQGTLPLETG
jgi:hypothetical protein